MSVTKKFIYLIAAGLLLLFVLNSVLLFFVYNAIVIGTAVIDYITSVKAADIKASRGKNNKLYYKAENEVYFEVKNLWGKPVFIELKEDLPDFHFKLLKSDLSGFVEDLKEFKYTVMPSKRGSFQFNTVNVKALGNLGLVHKFFTYSLPVEIKVYPNLSDLSKYRLVMQNNRRFSQGERRLRLQGVGTEFESLREYVEGDDFRKINWASTARENKLIVNQYESEKNQPIFLLIDTGRPLSYSLKGYKKLDYSINAALILSDIINQKGDNSGLMVFDTDIKSLIMPSKGDIHRNNLMETLYHIKDTKNTSDYEGAFLELVNRQKRRSLVFLFTDFETPEEAEMLLNSAFTIMRRHMLIIVLMKSHSVLALSAKQPEGLNHYYEKAISLEYLRQRSSIIKTMNAKGVYCIETDCENFTLSAVNAYLSIKNKNYS